MLSMSDHVHSYMHFMVINFEKPLYSYSDYDVIRVNKKYINDAIRNSQTVVFRTPNGEKVYYPKQIKKDGKLVSEIFKRPDEPMIMYEIQVPHSQISPLERWQL